jgi:hypothetical protein
MNVIMMIQTMVIAMMMRPPLTICTTKPKSTDASHLRSCVWKFTGEWISLYNIEAELQEVYLPRILFKIQYMRIYVNMLGRKVGNAYCTDVRGYLLGKLAPRFF